MFWSVFYSRAGELGDGDDHFGHVGGLQNRGAMLGARWLRTVIEDGRIYFAGANGGDADVVGRCDGQRRAPGSLVSGKNRVANVDRDGSGDDDTAAAARWLTWNSWLDRIAIPLGQQ